jgi:hypothetical protein
MSGLTTFSKVKRELAQRGEIQKQDYRCRYCGATAPFETLSTYGARCGACYADYCRAKQFFPDTGNKNDSPRSWAHALKKRHADGDRLTPAQISAYKAALRTTEAIE